MRRPLNQRLQLSEEVAVHLRDLIMAGSLRPGQRLRLEELAAQLGVRITPVREALLTLRSEGMVELEPRRGHVVAPMSRQDIDDVFTLQATLAAELAARAATRIGSAELADLTTTQALRHPIADLATEIECCRLLVYDVAAKVDANPSQMFPREASMAKLKVTETAKQVAIEGMQMMGRIRIRPGVRHGGARASRDRLHHLRRDQRDPARHHRQDLRTLTYPARFRSRSRRHCSKSATAIGLPM